MHPNLLNRFKSRVRNRMSDKVLNTNISICIHLKDGRTFGKLSQVMLGSTGYTTQSLCSVTCRAYIFESSQHTLEYVTSGDLIS